MMTRSELTTALADLGLTQVEAEDIANQGALRRNHTLELDDLFQRVAACGGPVTPWHVDLENNRATLGPITLTFYRLKFLKGGFSHQHYSCRDHSSTMERDWPLVEDGFACVASAFAQSEGL